MRVGILSGEHKGKVAKLSVSGKALFDIYTTDPNKYRLLYISCEIFESENSKRFFSVPCRDLVIIPDKPVD